MKTLGIANSMLLGSILMMAACAERNTLTASREQSTIGFDAAAALTSVVTDPVGDVKNKAPGWLDLTSASITRRAGRFLFTWDLAAPVPADPASDPVIPAHTDHVCIGDGLETDPMTAPVGYPFGKNQANFAEFYVAMCWNPTGSFGLGPRFVGLLVDRRPLLSGGHAVVAPIDLRVDKAQVVVVVDVAALGDPVTFAWLALTEVANQADPNDAAGFPDVAPDARFATWRQ